MRNVPLSQQLKIQQAESRAEQAVKQGKIAEAVELYTAILQLQPNHPIAKKSLDKLQKELPRDRSAKEQIAQPSQVEIETLVDLYQTGQMAEAELACGKLLRSYPQSLAVINILGAALRGQGKLQEAVHSYNKAIQLNPGYAVAHNNLGLTFHDLGQLDAAVKSYEKALATKSDFAEAHYNLGNALGQLGRLDEALENYGKATQLKSDYAEAYSNWGVTLQLVGELDEAIKNYDKAIQLNPDDATAYNNRGKALKDLRQPSRALKSFDKAIQFKPDYTEAYNNRGATLTDLGLLDDALKSYDKAIQLKSDYEDGYSNLLMTLNYTPDLNVSDYFATARKFGEIVTGKAKTHPLNYQCPPRPEKLRVGFVSGDLRDHPIGYFLESVLSSIDSSKIELIAYPTTPTVDALSERIKPSFSMWKPIYGQNDEAVANLIYADGVHILLDLSGHTAGNRLPMFGYKPSPVQASWLGYFATTGLNEMDYLIGDPYVTPPIYDDQFTEKVWRLPETRWCFAPPDVDIEVAAPPALEQGYVTFGCFNNITKVNEKVVELWAKVLEAVPDSRLLLKAKQFNDMFVRESITQRFTAHGIDSKRISLEGSEDRQKYFATFNKIDITLDPFPFTGGTTSVESLWMGVPLVTLAGDSLISRQGVGVLMNAGLPDWIAKDEEEYLGKAILFASDLDKLVMLRSGLRSQILASPLFDAPRFARSLENALWAMWNQRDRQ